MMMIIPHDDSAAPLSLSDFYILFIESSRLITYPLRMPDTTIIEETVHYHALLMGMKNNIHGAGKLLKKHGSWREAWEHRTPSLFGSEKPHELWEKLRELGIDLILREDDRYPTLLREMKSPPCGIYMKGNADTLAPFKTAPTIAIVGTRRATDNGIRTARRFAETFAARGISVVSGLAFGIDAASHEGTLAVHGHTIAVLAHGLDDIIPRMHTQLAQHILAAGGALISEYPPGTPSFPNQFVLRNRIVSGLSRGTLIIEAPEDSGALHTAYFAIEDNRDVFVIPGPINYANFVGSHGLIKNGATLVTCPEDIFEAWNMPRTTAPDLPQIVFKKPEMEKVFLAMKKEGMPVEIDKISKLINLDTQTVFRAIVMLEFEGLIQETNQGYEISHRRVTH
jgi:DNA processing protein